MTVRLIDQPAPRDPYARERLAALAWVSEEYSEGRFAAARSVSRDVVTLNMRAARDAVAEFLAHPNTMLDAAIVHRLLSAPGAEQMGNIFYLLQVRQLFLRHGRGGDVWRAIAATIREAPKPPADITAALLAGAGHLSVLHSALYFQRTISEEMQDPELFPEDALFRGLACGIVNPLHVAGGWL